MKLVHKDIGHIIQFGEGYVQELVIENKPLFFRVVNDVYNQADGAVGGFTLSVGDKPVEFSRYVDVTVQFAPFEINRKSLLSKLCSSLEKKALSAENYMKTVELLTELENFVQRLAEELPLEIGCSKVAIGPVLRAVAPEIEEDGKQAVEKVFEYMELVRELDRDRLFVMVNMRTYFSDDDMEKFAESAALHDFRVLLLESASFSRLKNTKRYTVDEDLCEF